MSKFYSLGAIDFYGIWKFLKKNFSREQLNGHGSLISRIYPTYFLCKLYKKWRYKNLPQNIKTAKFKKHVSPHTLSKLIRIFVQTIHYCQWVSEAFLTLYKGQFQFNSGYQKHCLVYKWYRFFLHHCCWCKCYWI